MKAEIKKAYVEILNKELVAALGCTEPGAIAYATAKARHILEAEPVEIHVQSSGNIIKNVKGVTVPNSGGLKGIAAAAILGALCGNPFSKLEVLDNVTEGDIIKTKALLEEEYCICTLKEGEGNLYINVTVKDSHGKIAQVIIKDTHTNIILIKKDGTVVYEGSDTAEDKELQRLKGFLNVLDIIDFAKTVDIEDVKKVLDVQIEHNCQIAEEGLKNEYGACVGRTLLDYQGNGIINRAKAKAAAASDARMGGSSLPVVINSGSGNQGITVTVPVVEYAKEWNASQEEIYRALIISNLISIHIKRYIGNLSAFCGAVSAACGSGAAIMYLHGGSYSDICSTISNTLGNVGGIVCDGAKASCAAKIASSVDAAILGYTMALKEKTFSPGEGFIGKDIEVTIQNVGHIGKVGMKYTDTEILQLMLENC